MLTLAWENQQNSVDISNELIENITKCKMYFYNSILHLSLL